MSVRSPNPLFWLAIAALPALSASPQRIVAGSLADLQACVDRPGGPELICALQPSSQPYAVTGSSFIIRRSNTTVEGAAEAGQDPPTIKRMDGSIKKLIWVQKNASHVTIRNLQIDGNSSLVPGNGIQDLSVDGSYVTVANNFFGDSSSLAMFFGGAHCSLLQNTFGKLVTHGASHDAPGVRPSRTAILFWGPNASQFIIDGNRVSDYNGAININDVPGGTDPAGAGVITNNTLYHNSICVPNCGGGQIYLFGKTTNVKITNNTINGGWAETSENRDTLHNYGIEVDGASYIYTSGNKISNNSISGMWIGNGAHHITVENESIYNNGLNGIQIAGNGRLKPVTLVSILATTVQHNDQHRSPRAPYPSLPRFWGVMIQNGAGSEVCIQADSNVAANARGGVYSESRNYARSPSCPRPYN